MIRLTAVFAVFFGLTGAAVTMQNPGDPQDPPPSEQTSTEREQAGGDGETIDPREDERLRGPTVEQILADLERQRGARPPGVDPQRRPAVDQARPGASGLAPWLDPNRQAGPNRLLLEGTFIFERRGRLARSRMSGEWYFVFDADAQGFADPPMIMLPCMALEHMERIAEARGDAVVFIVSGEVKVYHGRNYLLPTGYLIDIARETGLE